VNRAGFPEWSKIPGSNHCSDFEISVLGCCEHLK
jgi:hypothetical protein